MLLKAFEVLFFKLRLLRYLVSGPYIGSSAICALVKGEDSPEALVDPGPLTGPEVEGTVAGMSSDSRLLSLRWNTLQDVIKLFFIFKPVRTRLLL